MTTTNVLNAATLVRPVNVEGYGSPASWDALFLLANRCPHNQAIVELGVYKGQGLICLAQAGRPTYGVDTFKGETLMGYMLHFDHLAGSYKRACEDNVARYHLANVMLIESSSHDPAVVAKIKEPIGLVIIDADHTYEGALADFLLWAPRVAQGGTIVLDDVQCEGVQQLIAELPDHGWGVTEGLASRYAVLNRI